MLLLLPNLIQRPRDNDADDESSEDNISLVSRTPSPVPDVMDVDKYDEYYHDKPEPEVITVETKIKSTNIGFSMLAKMGWVEGAPLGLSGEGSWTSSPTRTSHIYPLSGRVDPVPFYIKNDLTGLGKANQDVRMSAFCQFMYCYRDIDSVDDRSRIDGLTTARDGLRAADKRDRRATSTA